MVEVVVEVDIARPAGEVFDFLTNMENNPGWQQGMESCTWTSEPPLRVGSTYDQKASFLGKKIVSSFEVTEFEPGHRFRIRTTSGTMPIDVVRSVEATGDGRCQVRAEVRGEPGGVFKVAGPLMVRMVRSSVEKDYARLKEQLESAD